MTTTLRNIIFLFCGLLSPALRAQQEAMFTQYMYNEVNFNPAYAGSHEVGSMTALYRKQWVNMDGAPETFSFNAHTPLKNGRNGLGLSLLNDKIGLTQNLVMNGIYAYRISFSRSRHLQLGLQAGMSNFTIDYGRLQPKYPGDRQFAGGTLSRYSMNFGAGAYYFSDKFYAGLSVPQLLNNRYKLEGESLLQQAQHLYLMSGYVWTLSPSVKLKPSMLYKFTVGAPLEMDVTAQVIFKEVLWVGAAWRSFDSVDGLLGLQAGKQLYIGYAYDFATTRLGDYHAGSHEILMNYRLHFSSKRVLTPRYF